MRAIILFEDDGALRDVLRAALEDEGHQVVTVRGVDQLPEQAARLPDALALVDGWGPVSGELSEADRRAIQDLAARLPTIVMTGRAWADRVAAEELGVVALLKKPADLNRL